MRSPLLPPARHALWRSLLGAAIALALSGWAAHAAAAEAADAGPEAAFAGFDRSMLAGAGQNTTDLARFERGDFIPAGSYRVDLYLNDRALGRADVRFAAPDPDTSATPCVSRALLEQLGLHPGRLDPAVDAALDTGCAAFDTVIPGGTLTFDMGELRLDAGVPQAALGLAARGYVAPEYWDRGIDAGILNYRLSSYRTHAAGQSQTSAWLGLNAGVNLGGWQLHHDSALSWQSAGRTGASRRQWQNTATWARHDVTPLRAQLTLGDAFTPGNIFDSVALRGVQLATDERMLPDSQRGYAPVVRGVADSNAKVTVRQNGMLIYQTTVAPGPFVIDDLYATGYGGDLDVTVEEANGRVHQFSVPYAAVPQLLRPGNSRFSIALGTLRARDLAHQPRLLQGTLEHGFSNLLTGYAGANAMPGYQSLLAGVALNTRAGAFALDLSHARTKLPGIETLSGRSLRLSWSKTLAETGTTLGVAAYRHATSGWLSLSDAAHARDYVRRGLPAFANGAAQPILIGGVPVSGLLTPAQIAALNGVDWHTLVAPAGVDRQRNDFTLTLSQRLGERGGALFANGSTRNYWNRPGRDTQYQVGYTNTLGVLSYGISASRERDLAGRGERRWMLDFTLPLGTAPASPALTTQFSRDGSGASQGQATLTGTAGRDARFNYGATLAHAGNGVGNSASLHAGWRGTHAQLDGGIGAGPGYAQASFGLAGGILAWSEGVSFGLPFGDTIGIIEADGAKGAAVGNASGVRIDASGRAIVPYLRPYQLNTITLDPTGLPLDVELASTSSSIAPRAGAVVRVKFATEQGRFVLIEATRADGERLPFGATVSDAEGRAVGLVAQAGRIMARLPADHGELVVRWSDDTGAAQSCRLPYQLPARVAAAPAGAIESIRARCEAPRSLAARSEP